MNIDKIREQERQVLALISEALNERDPRGGDPAPLINDARWVSIARTHFEQGFMALHRALGRD